MRVPGWILRSSFFRGVVAIAGGTALAQVAGVLFMPLLTRLYSPETMALWGLFSSFLGVASVLSTLRYEVALVVARDEAEALSLTRTTLVLALLTAFVSVAILYVLRVKNLFGYGAFPEWGIWLAFPTLLAFTWGTLLRYYGVRKGAFHLVGRLTVIQGVGRPLAQALCSFLGGAGLLVGEALGRLLGLLSLWRLVAEPAGGWFSLRVLWAYRAYPLVQLPSSLLNTLAQMATVPIFTALYGPAVGGALVLAQRVVALPVSLVGGAVADVFYSRAAELARQKPEALKPFFLATAGRLLFLSLLLGAGLGVLSPIVVPWLFGSAWEDSGKMMALMVPWMVAQLTVSPVSRVVFLSQRPWIKLLYDLLSLVVVAFLMVLGLPFIQALLFLSLSNALLYFVYFCILLWILQDMSSASRSGAEMREGDGD